LENPLPDISGATPGRDSACGEYADFQDGVPRVAAEPAGRAPPQKAPPDNALIRSERRFRQLADAMPQIVWTAEPDGDVDYASQAFTEYTGLDAAELASERLRTAIHPDDLAPSEAAWADAMRGGALYSIELRLRRADGVFRWHLARAVPVRDEQGNIVKWYGTATDIDDRKLIEHELSRLAARLTTTLESITDAFFTLDRDWRFSYVNRQAEQLLGRPADQLLGKRIGDECGELAHGVFDAECRRAVEQRRTIVFEQFHAATGQWFEVRAYPSEDGLSVSARDISGRKRAEEAMHESAERFSLVAKATTDAIWDWDLKSDTLWWSEGLESLFGFSPANIGHGSGSWSSRIHPDDKERVLQGIDAVIRGDGGNWSDEYRFLRKDGGYAHVLDRGFVIRDGGAKAVRMVGGMSDLSSRKESELALARVNRALRMLSACNELLIHVTDESQLITEICRLASTIGGYRMAWVGYARNDAGKTVEPMAYAGELADSSYLDEMRVSWSEHEPAGRGPGGRAIRSGEPVVCGDISADPDFAVWRAPAQRNGYRGLVVLPLREKKHAIERAFGILALYSGEARSVAPEEVRLLQELADNLAFGIRNLRTREERQRIEAAVLKVAAGVSASSGAEFFEQLARSMAEALGADAACVAKWLPGEPPRARVISSVADGRVTQNYDYAVEGTPCERLVHDPFCVIPENAAERFPHASMLAEFGAQAYVGRRLDNSAGQSVGLLYVLFRKPVAQLKFVTSTLQIFAARAAAELERLEADARIRDQASLLDKAQDAIIVCGIDHRVLYWNKGAERLYGWTAAEALGQCKETLLCDDPAICREATDTVFRVGDWSGEMVHRRKDGGALSVEGHWTLVRNDDGAPESIFTINTDITQRRVAEREIQYLAFYDILTGLPNRRLLHERLEQAAAACVQSRRAGALLIIDLDNFKSLNDTLGHDAGDLLLQHVALRLKGALARSGTLARIGGDEFVVVLEDLSPEPREAAAQASKVGERILAIFTEPFALPAYQHHITPSIGVALFNEQPTTADELLKRADLAMYRAKAAGRNAIRFYDPEMQAAVRARVAMEKDFRRSLRQQDFHLDYQPQADSDGRTTGTEALVRWRHPVRGAVSPAEFIPLAEDTGLILPLGRWVLESACKQLALWARQPETAHLSIAVNVSAREFRHAEFVDQVLAVLARTGADPNKLKLELTESLLVEDMEGTIAKMTALKQKGVGFSLDDFGTGYSSLSYLKRLPLDQLKIDRSFVRDVLTNPNDAAIARTIVALGQSLGLNVIAEGVETQAQRDCLAAYGCDAYQGYLYGQPLSAEQLGGLMRRAH
jgi:diguanylate cyclase (GGDEF)-like protein/PAS domain S-box-containing protein